MVSTLATNRFRIYALYDVFCMYLNRKSVKGERGLIWRHLKIGYDWKRSLSLEDGRYLLRVHIDRGLSVTERSGMCWEGETRI